MGLELRVAPAGVLAHVAAAKTKVRALDPLPRAFRAHHLVDEQEQPPRLRREFVERTPQHFMCQPVGRGDIVERHFDVFECLAVVRGGFPLPLMLVQQRDGADERQIFHVIAQRARLAVQEREFSRVRICYEKRFQKPLRVLVHAEDFLALSSCQQPFDGLRFALLFVDRLRLRAAFVHGQHQATIL